MEQEDPAYPGRRHAEGWRRSLPALIDQLTPKGKIEQSDDLSAALSKLGV